MFLEHRVSLERPGRLDRLGLKAFREYRGLLALLAHKAHRVYRELRDLPVRRSASVAHGKPRLSMPSEMQ